jgi:hypothetical protein
VVAKKKTKETQAQKRSSVNPFTGTSANQFTDTTNTTLPNAVVKGNAPKVLTRSEKIRKTIEAKNNKTSFNKVYESPSSPIDPALGNRFIEPENIPALRQGTLKSGAGGTLTPALVGWVAGVHNTFPDKPTGPAINEPHEAAPHEVVQRRLEDLSGNEIEHMDKTMSQYGYAGDTPQEKVGHLGNIQMRNMFRVLSENTQAGVNENSRQLFYGGTPNTRISDPVLHKLHEDKVLESQRRFNMGVSGIANHPEFTNRFGHLPGHEQDEIARTMEATALADTSPNSKWQTSKTGRWPNMEQGEEVVSSEFEGRPPKFISGRVQNNVKAQKNIAAISTKGPSALRDMTRTPKTTPFRGALIQHDSPDSFTVSDIHEGKQIAPHLTVEKPNTYVKRDSEGNQVGNLIQIERNQPVPRGYKPHVDETGKQKTGDSQVESMLSDSHGTIHAANDYATRQVNAELGISRGVNYADNLNVGQAARWGSQQQHRADVPTSHADLYPVVRSWGSEGSTLAKPSWMPENSGQWDALFEDKSASPVWEENKNTNSKKDPTTLPYIV